MDDVIKMGISDGIWYYDNTKRPGPSKQRNFAVYPKQQQDMLNESLQNNFVRLRFGMLKVTKHALISISWSRILKKTR